jgi:phosphoribosylformylglycinamidine synthase subunit PurQ / glutaminase
MEDNDQIAFRYVDPSGDRVDQYNSNGSIHAIAGVLNESGNVLGLMPHPERATNELVGGTDGMKILNGLKFITSNL